MLKFGDYTPNLILADTRWAFQNVFPEDAEAAISYLRQIYEKVASSKRRWNERETIRRVIVPILQDLLGYPSDDMSETPDPLVYYGERRLDVDFIVRNDCVIEAKKIKAPLLAWSSEYGSFSNAIDQGLTYLDNYNTNFCIITNGWDWYLFSKSENWKWFEQGHEVNYFGIRFRLDEIAYNNDAALLSQFIGLFSNSSVSGRANNSAIIQGCTEIPLRRNLYETTAKIFLKDFSNSPKNGPGSGFRWTDRS